MIGELIPDSQSESVGASLCAREGSLTRVDIRRRLERITKAYRSVEAVDMYHVKRDVYSSTVVTFSSAQQLSWI